MLFITMLMSLTVFRIPGDTLPWPAIFPGILFAVLFLLNRAKTGGFNPASPGFGTGRALEFYALPPMRSTGDVMTSPLLPLCALLLLRIISVPFNAGNRTGSIASAGILLTAIVWFIAGAELINRRHTAVTFATVLCGVGCVLFTVPISNDTLSTLVHFLFLLPPLGIFLIVAARVKYLKILGGLLLVTGILQIIRTALILHSVPDGYTSFSGMWWSLAAAYTGIIGMLVLRYTASPSPITKNIGHGRAVTGSILCAAFLGSLAVARGWSSPIITGASIPDPVIPMLSTGGTADRLMFLLFAVFSLRRIVLRLQNTSRAYAAYLMAAAGILIATVVFAVKSKNPAVFAQFDHSVPFLVLAAVAGSVSGNKLPFSPTAQKVLRTAALIGAVMITGFAVSVFTL